MSSAARARAAKAVMAEARGDGVGEAMDTVRSFMAIQVGSEVETALSESEPLDATVVGLAGSSASGPGGWPLTLGEVLG